MLAPKQSNPKKQQLSIAFVVIAFAVIGWLLWRQFFGGPSAADIAETPAVTDDTALTSEEAQRAATVEELDLSFLESLQFRELRSRPITVATSTERSVNPFASPTDGGVSVEPRDSIFTQPAAN